LFTRDRAHWLSHLAGAAFDSIPTDSPDPSRARETASARVAINASNVVRLKALAQASRTTLFALLLGLYFSTIHRLAGKRELTVTSVFANRLRPDLRHTVGFLANLVALRSMVPRDGGFQDILAATSLDLRDTLVHQAYPLHMLPAELTVRVRVDVSMTPCFRRCRKN
jgi:non-ribosomal peptide synthetase component F